MKLFVLRHGRSPSLLEAGVESDFDRPLAAQGLQDVRRMAGLLLEKEGAPRSILASPLVRAQQTAREAAAVLKVAAVETFAPLDNRFDARALWDALRPRLKSVSDVLLVGHQPQLGELVAYLTGTAVELRPGGLAVLETDEERVRILWTQNP